MLGGGYGAECSVVQCLLLFIIIVVCLVDYTKTLYDRLLTSRTCPILITDSCADLKSVGKPVTHNTQYYIQGAWMKDPLGILGTEAIFVMNNYGSNKLVEYENMDKFKAGVPFKKYSLPYNWDGTGAVVYGPYLYYNR